MRGVRCGSMLVLALGAAVACADPPGIRFPAAPLPTPPPAPVPQPGSVPRLTPDTLYVIDSDVPLLVFVSPAGAVKVVKEEGPLRIRGKFVGGNGKVETRTFKGKFVVTLEPAATTLAELIVVPEGAKTEADAVRKLLDVDDGTKPIPPPPPDPPPDPKPKPPPDPKPDDSPTKLIVTVVDETAARATAVRGRMLFDGGLALRWQEKGHVWRFVDKDVVGADGQTPKDVKRFIDLAAGKDYPMYFLVDPTGKLRGSGKVPATNAEFLAEVRKVGG